MGFILNDYRCPKCGFEIGDHISDRSEAVSLVCECGIDMVKVPQFAKPRKEWPDYAQKEAMMALDPETDSKMYRAAKGGHLHREDWDKKMKEKGYARTDASELEESAKKRQFLKKNSGDPEERRVIKKRLADALTKKKRIEVVT
jgi:hypothetical protein